MVSIISAEEYFQFDAMNQSLLKSYSLKDPRLISKDRPESDFFYEEKAHFIIGSAVDCILTEGIEAFKAKYYISNLTKKPSLVQKSIINEVYSKLLETTQLFGIETIEDPACEDLIFMSCVSHNHYDNIKDKIKKVATITKHQVCKDYFLDLKNAGTRTVLDMTEYDLILNVVNSLSTNTATADYFKTNQPEGIKIYNQFGIVFMYRDVLCKALLDMVVINEIDKTITPVDLKTTSKPTYDFDKAVRERRYDVQAAWYTLALEELIKVDPNFMGYTILPFKFIAESTTTPGMPLVLTCDEELLNIGRYGELEGYVGNSDGTQNELIFKREILGFEQMLHLYLHYEEVGYSKHPNYEAADGQFTLSWHKIQKL